MKPHLLTALFSAFSVILSQIAVPIGPVPVTFTHISVFLAAGLLGAKKAAFSQLIFVLLGLAGLPVFAGFAGGIGVLFGPTGGFIIGYIGCAFTAGLLIEYWGKTTKKMALSLCAGWAVTYICGIPWFAYSTQTGLYAAFMACFLPFIPGDIFKTLVSIILIKKLKPILQL